MSPVTHFLAGWLAANAADLEKRDRLLVTVSAVVPDVDSLGVVIDFFNRDTDAPKWFGLLHHVLSHNVGFAVLMAICAFILSKRKWPTTLLVIASIHLHFLGDLAGARGPDGYQWPIPYLLPFSDAWQLTWAYQWGLTSWQNFTITATAMAVTIYLAWRRGYSPLEIISGRADGAFVNALRSRFGKPK